MQRGTVLSDKLPPYYIPERQIISTELNFMHKHRKLQCEDQFCSQNTANFHQNQIKQFFQHLLIKNYMIHVILWHVDPLLGSDREIGDRTAAVAIQRLASNNRGMAFIARSTPMAARAIRA
jgi:hypothetical protein